MVVYKGGLHQKFPFCDIGRKEFGKKVMLFHSLAHSQAHSNDMQNALRGKMVLSNRQNTINYFCSSWQKVFQTFRMFIKTSENIQTLLLIDFNLFVKFVCNITLKITLVKESQFRRD